MSERAISHSEIHVCFMNDMLSNAVYAQAVDDARQISKRLALLPVTTILNIWVCRDRVIGCRVGVGSVHITHRYACLDHEGHSELFGLRVRCRAQKLDAETSRVTPRHHNPQHLGLS